MSKALTITFNDTTRDIRATDDGLVNLTDLWKAAGSPANKRPIDWTRPATRSRCAGPGVEFANYAADMVADRHVLVSKSGRGGGTFATRELAIAYAQWISPAFQMVVCKVFLAQWDSIPQAPRIEDGGLMPVLDRPCGHLGSAGTHPTGRSPGSPRRRLRGDEAVTVTPSPDHLWRGLSALPGRGLNLYGKPVWKAFPRPC